MFVLSITRSPQAVPLLNLDASRYLLLGKGLSAFLPGISNIDPMTLLKPRVPLHSVSGGPGLTRVTFQGHAEKQCLGSMSDCLVLHIPDSRFFFKVLFLYS